MPISFDKFRKKSFPLKVCCHSPKLCNTRGGEGDTFYGKKALVKINALSYPFQLICLLKYSKLHTLILTSEQIITLDIL